VVKPQDMSEKFIVLDRCNAELTKHFAEPAFIGAPLYISDIYKVLKDVVGVLDVVKVKISNKTGTGYSMSSIDINRNISGDGSYLIVPKNAILELKYPRADIVGKIR